MDKFHFSCLYLLLIKPKRFFSSFVAGTEFRGRDLFILGVIIIPIITLVYGFKLYAEKYMDYSIEMVVYLAAFTIGQIASFAFRTYFISMILDRSGTETGYKKIGMVVGFAMSINILMTLVPIIFQTQDYNMLIEVIFKIWNLSLIVIGIIVLTEIKLYRAVLIVMVMFGFEMLVKTTLMGIQI